MYLIRFAFTSVVALSLVCNLRASDSFLTVTDMRARLSELGGYVIDESQSRAPEAPPHQRSPREESLYNLARAPRDLVRDAIDQALRKGSKQEVIGALALYNWIVTPTYGAFPQEALNPAYLPVLYDLLKNDDRTLTAYTESLAGSLSLYPPSRETILVYMSLAKQTLDAKTRQDYILLASDELGIDLPIYKQTPALQRQKILADFETWFEKNQKYIEFDEKGRSSLAGSKVQARRRGLTDLERAKIRKDPACVLELFQGSGGMEISEERTEALLKQCGEALFGAEGAKLMREMMAQPQGAGTPTFDQQMGLASARGKYPSFDAGLLAVAYVAADDPDPKHRELAKKTLDDIGTPEEITRVLKGEPKEVRKKAMELADEMNEKGS